jgi:DNA replication and repair protein RecF
MRIRSARLDDFRNLASVSLELGPGLNALVGPNGQGKTNLVEGLYCVAALRPLRSVPRSGLLRSGCSEARVRLVVAHERTGLEHALGLELRRGSRSLSRDDKGIDAAAFLGGLTAVAFTPDDLEISKGAPEVRRRFLDRAILNTRPAYLERALRFVRALKGRNKLLSDGAGSELIEVWDETLAAVAAEVAIARARYVAELEPRILSIFARIADPAPPLEVRLRSVLGDALDVSSVPATTAAFRRLFAERRAQDRQRRTTTAGPHHDELELRLDGTPARLVASQGQHRALVLALKLAEIEHLTERLGEPPVLLLDDISSELDAHRTRQLFDTVAALDAQVVLTTTDGSQIPSMHGPQAAETRRFEVSGGRITPSPTLA